MVPLSLSFARSSSIETLLPALYITATLKQRAMEEDIAETVSGFYDDMIAAMGCTYYSTGGTISSQKAIAAFECPYG
jgi:hypothetical protein